MAITKRSYQLLSDFPKVHQFLTDNYNIQELNGMLLPQFFEYAHTHPLFNHKLTHRMTIWEDRNTIIAFCCYEMDIGEAFLVKKNGYETLLAEMLKQAECELSVKTGSKRALSVWVTDTQSAHINLLKNNGYTKTHAEPVRILEYQHDFPKHVLPNGFSCMSLNEGNDLFQLHRCMHRGFEHEGEPNGDIDCRRLMQSGPHFRQDLSTVIKAPDGDYACFAGIWFDKKNKYAYLEPLCTMPEYRCMGLATYALTEAMKKTKALGAEYCFGGVPEFYTAIGFETICHRELWSKEWRHE